MALVLLGLSTPILFALQLALLLSYTHLSFFSLLNGLQLLVKVRNRKRIAISTIVPKYAFFY